jgi:hypothetical protein
MSSRVIVLAVFLVVTTVSAWITAIRMRRRIRRALGKDVTEAELTSLSTWMNVDEAEERNRGGKII